MAKAMDFVARGAEMALDLPCGGGRGASRLVKNLRSRLILRLARHAGGSG